MCKGSKCVPPNQKEPPWLSLDPTPRPQCIQNRGMDWDNWHCWSTHKLQYSRRKRGADRISSWREFHPLSLSSFLHCMQNRYVWAKESRQWPLLESSRCALCVGKKAPGPTHPVWRPPKKTHYSVVKAPCHGQLSSLKSIVIHKVGWFLGTDDDDSIS